MKITELEGGITATRGLRAGGVHCGIKKSGAKDLMMFAFDEPCLAAAVFTTNKARAAFIDINLQHLENNMAQAMVVNSGCANACTGEKGVQDAQKVNQLCADALGIDVDNVLSASTGHIGDFLPMEKIAAGIAELAPQLSPYNGDDAATAIMTTDTVVKKVTVTFEINGKPVYIGAIAKGAGMIEPNMATMLSFITTDAVIGADYLNMALRTAVSRSFNKITVDSDQSTNDSVFIFSNGSAGNDEINDENYSAEFQEALDYVCLKLAKMIVVDGEGATKFMEIKVAGADTTDNALTAARTMANSPLFKCAVYGKDPNWGRLMAAIGSSGVPMDPRKVDIFFGDVHIVKDGLEIEHNHDELQQVMDESELYITLDLHLGDAEDRIWTCDFSHEYVDINMA